jgi:hypothetical protein
MYIERAGPGPLWKRLGWFVGLWAASVAVIGIVAYALRAVLLP